MKKSSKKETGRDKKKRKDEKCERRSINRGMLLVQECREAFSVRRRRRSNQGFVEFDFRRLSSEEQVNEMVSCFFHLHVKFVCACVSVFTLTVVDERCAAHERDERGTAPSRRILSQESTRGNECGHSQAWNVALPAR